jgi:DNA polymerase III epsilon subunit-like protein
VTSALWGPPGNMRLIAIDLETSVAPDRKHRIVALGAVVCRAGGIRQRFTWLVNPGVPIDPQTSRVHGITDDDVAVEPTFDDVLPEFTRLLTARAGERVVLAAHNARFDIPWLRSEVARVGGQPLPDLPVMDTAGPLVRLAGLSPGGRSLADLLDALGLANPAPHDALGDAHATALAACALLRMAEEAGHTDLDELATIKSSVLSAVQPTSTKPTHVAQLAAPLPPAHVQSHAAALSDRPTPSEVARWRQWIAECADLRCEALADRSVIAPPTRLRPLLFAALTDRAASGDAAGTATVLGALMPLLGALPRSITELRAEGPTVQRTPGQSGRRGVAIVLHSWLDGALSSMPRCPDDDPCPSCRLGEPCPRDVWPQSLVPSLFDGRESAIEGFWNTRGVRPTSKGKGAGRAYLAVRRVAPGLADAALRHCYRHWRDAGKPAVAAQLADQAWREAGCRDPLIAEARALVIARAGRPNDLRAALRDCQVVLACGDGSTDPAWSSLALRAAQIEGRLGRLLTPPARSHRAAAPKRPPRPPRFLRT